MSQTIFRKYKRTGYSDADLLEGLKQQQEWAVREIYKTRFNVTWVLRFVIAELNRRLQISAPGYHPLNWLILKKQP